ncbi:MAG TPA: D-alanine--D-alanine ligase A, partial [Acidimicrobiia bacterium]|nr:D-alanine--D-alanine ligase A [Acidimicrobiia bacterium]
MSAPRRLRVLLLFGGRSAEHDVSRVSAMAVARALDPERYEVVPVAITKAGRWLLNDGAAALLAGPRGDLPEALEVAGRPVAEVPDPVSPALVPLDEGGDLMASESMDFDVAIPMLHGPFGEDGTIQGLLELAGIPYVGSGVVGSAVGMDKVMMKRALKAAGLPLVRHAEFREWEVDGGLLDRIASDLGFPCFVKPANLGSSVAF